MISFRSLSLLSCSIAFALLQGCGGGGGGSDTSGTAPTPNSSAPSTAETVPAAPVPTVDFGIKQLRFSWPAVPSAGFYRVLEDADGSGAFASVGGDLNTTAYNRDIAVHAFNWAAARYRVQACNSAGCSTSTTLDASAGVLRAIGYFKASNTSSGDTFGWSLTVSDDGGTLAIGAPSEDGGASGINGDANSDSSVDSGAVYIFTHVSGGWSQQAYVKAATNQAGANFGESVALSSDGNTLAVGAPFESSDAGATYIYTRSGATWGLQSRIQASNAYTNAYFGWAVALSDNGGILAIGSPGESSNSGNIATNTHSTSNAGAVYVFTRSGNNWGNQVYLKAATIAADDNFGAAIAFNGTGNVLAAGAPHKASGAGAVYVFSYDGSAWSAPTAVTTTTDSGDNFGAALALDNAGDTLAVGAPYEASSARGINASQTDNSAAFAGAAYVFARSGSTWSQQAYVKASNTDINDDFGSAVALSGDGSTLAVGAIGESSNATGIDGNQNDNSTDGVGAVYLYKRDGTSWAQQRYIKPSTSSVGDEFGTAIGMSSDAGTLAISGAFERSSATGIGGIQTDASATDAGAVWLF